MTDRPEPSQSGFTLIELSIVLVVIGMVIAMFSHIGVGYLEAKQREATNLKLDAIEEALVRFVAATKRLPCPAAVAGTGVEDREPTTGTCNGNQQTGVVPWVTLGLPKSAVIDGWNNFITYRVYPEAVASNALDMSSCAVTNTSCLSVFLNERGLLVADVSGVTNVAINNPWAAPATGAAYILVSHGQDGFGAYTSGGALRAAPISEAEQRNANNNNVLVPLSETNWENAYYNKRIIAILDDSHFDDVVRHRTILDVAVRAGLGPT